VGIFKIQSIDRVIQWSQKQGEQLYLNSKQVGTKISSFVLRSISGQVPKKEGVRKPTIAKVLDPSKSVLKTPSPLDQKVKKHSSITSSFGIPIGLHPCLECSWVNAWMQFLIYLPRFVDLSPFAVKAFDPFHFFLDQYLLDQKEGRAISSADSSYILHSLKQIVDLELEEAHLGDVSSRFFREVFPFSGGESSSLIFHPDWIVTLDTEIQESLARLYKKRPLEILIGAPFQVSSKILPVQGQLFPKKGGCFYDLRSFIEARPDKYGITFVTYIKLGRVWYQCDDEAVQIVSSAMMDVPLQRGILFHYKQVTI